MSWWDHNGVDITDNGWLLKEHRLAASLVIYINISEVAGNLRVGRKVDRTIGTVAGPTREQG